jgi:transposase
VLYSTDLITYGYSNSGDGDKKQVNLGLNVNLGGIPLYHRTMEGNKVDKVIVAENMRALKRTLKTSRFLMVGDRGMMTKKNMARMQGKRVGYLGSYQLDDEAREMVKGIPEEEFELLKYRSGRGGRYYGCDRLIGFQYKGRDYVSRAMVVKSEEKAEKDRERRSKDVRRLEAGLEDIGARLNTRKYKRREYVKGRAEKLFTGKMHRYKKFFDVRLEGEDGKLRLGYSIDDDAVADGAKMDGKYVLVTDQPMGMDEALLTYKSREPHRGED